MNMKTTVATKHSVAGLIAERLSDLLEKGPVTWLVSGGSNIMHQVETLNILINTIETSNLTILLIDERYGKVGHADSNWSQLTAKGFMVPGPTFIAPFTESETTLELAVARYETIMQQIFDSNNYTYAQLGMGSDGHVSGILPGSSAAHETKTLVTGYVSEQYQRLTTTFPALRRLDEVALVAFGDDKQLQLERLAEMIDPVEQPVQILKDIPCATLYTDNDN